MVLQICRLGLRISPLRNGDDYVLLTCVCVCCVHVLPVQDGDDHVAVMIMSGVRVCIKKLKYAKCMGVCVCKCVYIYIHRYIYLVG